MSIHARVHTSNQTICCESLPGNFPLYHLAQIQPQRYPYFLESTAQAEPTVNSISRYDILFAFPLAKLTKLPDNTLSWKNQPLQEQEFLPALDRIWQAQQQPMSLADIPFTGGWFVYLGYELAAEIEPRLQLPKCASALPIAEATRIPAAVIYDHQSHSTHLVAEATYASCLEQMKSDLLSLASQPGEIPLLNIDLQEDAGDRYLHNVAQALEYIRAGDVYQVNLSRSWTGKIDKDESLAAAYSRLRDCNPAPFAGLARFADGVIISSSPERLVRVRNGVIETRPIAGTRPRDVSLISDRQLQRELLAHPKERAEHVMLLDLERNDLGRICLPGTVQVNQLMCLESYAHVHHIVSNVTGQLRANTTPGEIIRAVFPGGTITGCPKVRCMEIIAELEQTPRGAYTGSFGYLTHTGDMDLNILIRSIIQDGDSVSIRAGAGIVADSIAQHELQETRAKAKGMLAALQKQL